MGPVKNNPLYQRWIALEQQRPVSEHSQAQREGVKGGTRENSYALKNMEISNSRGLGFNGPT
jgi:hypothetical protein